MNECEVWSFGLALGEKSMVPVVENFKGLTSAYERTASIRNLVAVKAVPLSAWPWMTEFSVQVRRVRC